MTDFSCYTQPTPTNLLQKISDAQRVDLLAIGKCVDVKKSDFIFHAGKAVDHVYILLSGRVKIYKLSLQGKQFVMWFCFPGELFGLANSEFGLDHDVYAHACSQVELVQFDRARFLQYLQGNPDVSLKVIDVLSYRMRLLGDMLMSFSSADVSSRLLKLLIRLFQCYGQVQGCRIYINMPLTHQEMADMIGCCRQTATMALNELKQLCGLGVAKKRLYLEIPSPDQVAQTLMQRYHQGKSINNKKY